ncbi:transporter [Neisseria subflava]|nr:transporter [Neisseria subflava]
MRAVSVLSFSFKSGIDIGQSSNKKWIVTDIRPFARCRLKTKEIYRVNVIQYHFNVLIFFQTACCPYSDKGGFRLMNSVLLTGLLQRLLIALAALAALWAVYFWAVSP